MWAVLLQERDLPYRQFSERLGKNKEEKFIIIF